MSGSNSFHYLSASAVSSRLSVEEREEYYLNLIKSTDDAEDSEGLCVEDNAEGVDSDAEMENFAVEANEESDCDDNEELTNEAVETLTDCDSFFATKDGVKLLKQAPPLSRLRASNLFRDRQFIGPNPNTKNMSKLDTFNCIITPAVRDLIRRFSNKKAESEYAKWNDENPDKPRREWNCIRDEELSAFFGILLIMGVHKSNQESLAGLWKKNAYPLYRATMSRNRFADILRYLRFNWHLTRAVRAVEDKAAPIRYVFDMVNANLRANYRPHESVTVDEQLFGYRGRTRFTQYMPSKPAKYGIKIWWVCDSSSFYPLQAQLYTGKIDNVRDVNQGERIVKDLVSEYKNSGRNVTMDNFFTTLTLAKELANWKLTVVGTVKKNKRYVPYEFKPSPSREIKSSLFEFSENVTFCSYVPAKNKSVVLLSTVHNDKTIIGPEKKPEIILYYNSTKGGVDTMDKMLAQYTTKRATLRCPLALFFNILDTSALAAFIIYQENNEGKIINYKKRSQRKQFLECLGEELCGPLILERSKNPHVIGRYRIRSAIECVLGKPIGNNCEAEDFEADVTPERDATGRIKHRGKCYMCYVNKQKRNTRQVCIKCKKPVCAVHSISQTKCENCFIGPSSSSDAKNKK